MTRNSLSFFVAATSMVAALLFITSSFVSADDESHVDPKTGLNPDTEVFELKDQNEPNLRRFLSEKYGMESDEDRAAEKAAEMEEEPDDTAPPGSKTGKKGVDRYSHVQSSTSACDTNPNSEECRKELEVVTDQNENEVVRMNKTVNDFDTYSKVVERFEFLLNEWACAATGNALFTVRGDHDILNYCYRLLAHILLDNGQHYGSNIVIDYHTHQENQRQAGSVDPHTCETTELGNPKYFNSVMAAMVKNREMLEKWFEANEVEIQPIFTSYLPEVHGMIKKWALGRLLHKFGQCIEGANTGAERHEAAKKCPARKNELLMALLPIIRDETNPLDECQAGGQLMTLIDSEREGTVHREVSRMLDQCFEQGKLSEDPIEFGETLRQGGREKQARQLFELAVERGKLCNVWQRPEEHHRKDITAAPVWTEESFPVLKNRAAELRDMIKKVEPGWNWNEVSTMHPAMRTGYWQRAYLFGNHEINPMIEEHLSADDIKKLKDVVAELRTSNDAYDWGCNGSIIIEAWRISGQDAQSDKMVGSTNLVLQYLSPIRGDKRLVVQLGEDTAQIDPEVSDDVLVYDDSFEHRFFFEGVKPADEAAFVPSATTMPTAEKKDELVLLHVQVCHPEMHEKALDPPGKVCADTEWE